jgi:integrase
MILNQREIDRGGPAMPVGKSDAVWFDDTLPGFGLRRRPSGVRTYVVQYKFGAKHRRMTLGAVTDLRLDDARDQARNIFARVRLGQDPANDKALAVAESTNTFAIAAKLYLTDLRSKLRPSSAAKGERYLLDDWKPLHTLPLTKVDRRTVAARLTALRDQHGPASAGRARATLSAFFGWAMREGLADANPVIGTNNPYEGKGRERVLSGTELAEVWKAAGAEGAPLAYGIIVRLLILTGQRREEIGGLKWSEIDLASGLIRLPGERVKNHRAHDVPLAEPALALLRAVPHVRDFVFGAGANGFAGYSIPKRELDRKIAAARQAAGREPMPPWILHDLRRSCATHMAELGVQPHIVEAVLNHASGHKAGVAGVYNKAPYEREKRQALALWADRIMAMVEGRDTNVVALLVMPRQ